MTRVVAGSRTLDDLDPPAWGEPTLDSHLVTTCHRLRRKPLGEYSVEDLRIMIGERIGLDWLVPLALEVLEREPLAAGDFYPGDLLGSVLRIGSEFWSREVEWCSRTRAVLDRIPAIPEEVREAAAAFRANVA